ncbi:hypothetical protein NMY22_g13741 [Coprinellus aureogranulatus]|nr:hypothetical protein NMY22_g13741 [Coprinellus aureogranulatus]
MNRTPTNLDNEGMETAYDKKYLRILQINVNKSNDAHLELLNNNLHKTWDIVLIQEPHQNYFKNIATAKGFRQVYPSRKARENATPRSGIWVSERISTNTWHAVNVNDSPDITAIQLSDPNFGQLTIFNVYNDCTHNDTTTALNEFLTRNEQDIYGEGKHVVWAGDFNRHHRMWDNDEDERLFTAEASRMAEDLIFMLSEWNMNMALPKGIRTLKHFRSKEESRPDNVFCTDSLLNRIIACNVRMTEQPPKTDHYPIATVLDISKNTNKSSPRPNFKNVDWKEFNKALKAKLALLEQDSEKQILTEQEFNERVNVLTKLIQDTIDELVPTSRPSDYSRRWWNKELSAMRERKKELISNSQKYRAIHDHPAHEVLRRHMNEYATAIVNAKKEHWESFLNEADTEALWIASKYLTCPVGDGYQACMPPLKQTNNGNETIHCTNEQKAKVLSECFFPHKPTAVPQAQNNEHQQYQYEPPLEPALPITAEIVKTHLARLSPHKAPGLDATIFNAVFELNVYHEAWKESITCVLRKPGRPTYEVAKSYRPIALLSTIGKVLSSIVADDISRLIEEHELLPPTHFGGRPNRTTTDALHYLVMRIKQAWRRGDVVSVLFLDVEGAFPNAVTDKVLHNMRKRRIPERYVNMVANMLEGRKTKLRFDDFLSEFIHIDNGIGQGCPLSMILYIIYNADMIELRRPGTNAGAVGYVDDIALIAEGSNFTESTAILKDMMECRNGGLHWSKSHNSKFEMTKVAIMHFTRSTARGKRRETAPDLVLEGTTIAKVESYKYLGVIMDPELRWRAQEDRAVTKGLQWVALFKRLSNTRYGINVKLMRHLYRAVGIPKMTYAAEIWYDPPRKPEGKTRRIGSVSALARLKKVQRIAAIAITGALKSTAGDALDVHANLLPIENLLHQQLNRAYIRLCTLPSTHVLNDLIWAAHLSRAQQDTTTYPMQTLAHLYTVPPSSVEKIGGRRKPPTWTPPFNSHIDATREESIEAEKDDPAQVKVYTDGSAIDGQVGAAALLYIANETEPRRTLHLHLGPKSRYSTFDAEWAGALMATWLLKECTDDSIGKETATVYVDNQSVITTATKDTPGPAQYLKEAMHDTAEMIRSRGPVCKKFTLRWISAHSDVGRNERVDEEAKKAARGESSKACDLPYILRRPLPMSKSALVQEAKDKAKRDWKVAWQASTRSMRYNNLDEQFPPKTYLKVAANSTRPLASALTQIRTGHMPLNAWLHKRKLAETDKCQQCNDNKKETIHHFLFECKAYRPMRYKMDKAHKRFC